MGNLEIVKWSHFARESILDVHIDKVGLALFNHGLYMKKVGLNLSALNFTP
jgi:hypothetical protein